MPHGSDGRGVFPFRTCTLPLVMVVAVLLAPCSGTAVEMGEGRRDESCDLSDGNATHRHCGPRANGSVDGWPAWWRERVTFSGDMRAALAINVRKTRAGGDLAEPFWVVRIRGGLGVSPGSWLTATARRAAFFDKDLEDLDFRFEHRGNIRAGDVTFDTLHLSLNPHDWLTIEVGRLQTQFEIDSVTQDSLSRNDSGGVTVTWTDGVHVILGRPRSFRLHLIGQVNPEDGSTNGVGIREPISFADGASRITYYVAAEAPPIAPLTQLVADATVTPSGLRPSGLGTEPTEHATALTIKAAADFPTRGGPSDRRQPLRATDPEILTLIRTYPVG